MYFVIFAALAGCGSIGPCGSIGRSGPVGASPGPQVPWDGSCLAAVDLPCASGSASLVGQVDLDLALLVDMAFENSPETRRLWHGARAAAARSGTALSPLFPQIVAGGAVAREWQEGNGSHGRSTVGAVPSLSLTWRLFSFGSDLASARAARCNLQAANLIHGRSLQTLLFRVQSAYFSLNAAEATVEARAAALREAEELLALAESRFQAGLENRQNYLQARAAMLQARHGWEESRALVEQRRAALAEVVGVRVSSQFRIRRSQLPEGAAVEEDVEAIVARALRCRPDLLSLQAQLDAVRAGERAARGASLPRLVASVSADRLRTGGGGTERDAVASLGLSWDLFTGFERTARRMERREEAAMALESLRGAELRAVGEIWSAYQDHRAALRQLESARGLLAAADEAFHACEIAYRAGLCSFHELLAVQNRFAGAREGLVAAECRFSLSLAALAHAGGDLHCVGH
ncbi:MAG: TolC family protein [Puniceicoccales bacterium]|nr:TolC family protein [Puniceicoccales bacterium]